MNEGFPKPPSAGEMRAEMFERESARRREQEDAVLAQIDLLDQELAANPSADQTGERALLEATLTELQEQQKKAEALFETGR
ncbi:MAG: hypothetical protein KBD06_03345 [Candidatus Pacebacteria bacterium]|nr:hypothetical protein [Candidatus Paceibacterota bacterium]